MGAWKREESAIEASTILQKKKKRIADVYLNTNGFSHQMTLSLPWLIFSIPTSFYPKRFGSHLHDKQCILLNDDGVYI